MRKAESSRIKWTHPSVLKVAKDGDPEKVILGRARELVLRSLQEGWSGPPYDPFLLAEKLRISVLPNESILDARLISESGSKTVIEFNPNRPKSRIAFSIAHEIAHTLFEDFGKTTWYRHSKKELKADVWQLEMLCNIAAAEFLMPIGGFPELDKVDLSIDAILRQRKRYEVSAEAVLLRAVRLTKIPLSVFCVSMIESPTQSSSYKVDYSVNSMSLKENILRGSFLPRDSVVKQCTAIGFTAKGRERWNDSRTDLQIECLGVPPYPDHIFPRVVGIARPLKIKHQAQSGITYLLGDATLPRGTGTKIIAHIVNDKARSWGGGFGRYLKSKWPHSLTEYKAWLNENPKSFVLGATKLTNVEKGTWLCNLVAQKGYGKSERNRVLYTSLKKCLDSLATQAKKSEATVHMPRIGCGEGGASWSVISELIQESLCSNGIHVTVYDLPNSNPREEIIQESFLNRM